MADVIDAWLNNRRQSIIEGLKLRPRENPLFKGSALRASRGQGDAYYLEESNKREWILKKFSPGRSPDGTYIKAIGTLLPNHPGFESGSQRKVLTKDSLLNSGVGYFTNEFAIWLHNVILMMRVEGFDWAFWADKLRYGDIQFSKDQRLLLCKNLSEQILVLEKHGISHRDLSSTNILIDTKTWQIHLIDWDSLYHPTLQMPSNTTFGTHGYVSPLVRETDSDDPKTTWRPLSDRFSLATLNIEFLGLSKNSPLTGDGGMFEQGEMNNRGGIALRMILQNVQQKFPDAVNLFTRALNARSFEECPSPYEWIKFCNLGSGFKAPSLKEIYDPTKELAEFLKKWRYLPPKPVPPINTLENPNWPEILSKYSKDPTSTPSLKDIEDPTKDIIEVLKKINKDKGE